MSALLAILSTLRRTLGLNLLATLATAASPAADTLGPGLEVFVVAVPFMFTAFGIVLVFQIRIRILAIDCSAGNRRLFATFNVPFVFLAFPLFEEGLAWRRTRRDRRARFILESLAFVLTFSLFERFVWRRTWRNRRARFSLESLALALAFPLFERLGR
ncbi:MAG: hypothetical protein DME37_06945 [Verrucomicrobia bacterium]|nr:MAG: hypothetical protein DME37_06945 [Verrucomicrobiota bacterium]